MNVFSKVFTFAVVSSVAIASGFVIWNDLYAPKDKTFRTGGENVTLSKTNEYEKGKVGGSKFAFMLLSTRDLGNQRIWESRKEKVIRKLSSKTKSRYWASDSFFKGITKDDPDIVKKIIASCEKAYESDTPEDETNEWFFKVQKWKEVFSICKKN